MAKSLFPRVSYMSSYHRMKIGGGHSSRLLIASSQSNKDSSRDT